MLKITRRVPAGTLGRHACCALCSGCEARPITPRRDTELGGNREADPPLRILLPMNRDVHDFCSFVIL